MNIQSGYGALAYQGASRLGPPPTGATQPPNPAPAGQAAAANGTDRVSISSAAKALAAQEGGATQTRTPAQERLLNSASSDRQSAEKIAEDMARTNSTIFYNISGVGGGEAVNKLSTSGKTIDDAFRRRFEGEASQIDARRLAIYESEKAKGTDPVLILGKMIDFTNSQSPDYLDASGWGYRGASPP